MIPNDLKAKALIIDESLNWQGTLKRICMDLDLAPEVSGTLDEARTILNSNSFAIIIVDMVPANAMPSPASQTQMPDIHSDAQAQAPSEIDLFFMFLNRQHSNTPIMLFSGNPTLLDRHGKLATRSMRVNSLPKSADAGEIADTIQALTGISSSRSDAHLTHATNIFIVHGRAQSATTTVRKFIEKLGLNPVILSKQPVTGKTIIEDLERHTNVSFVVVLLTPDDIGYLKGRPRDKAARARQNVIFELGFCMGKLGRSRVCALYKGRGEIPTDIYGVRYIQMDSRGAWKDSLAEAIQTALKSFGIDVDLTRMV